MYNINKKFVCLLMVFCLVVTGSIDHAQAGNIERIKNIINSQYFQAGVVNSEKYQTKLESVTENMELTKSINVVLDPWCNQFTDGQPHVKVNSPNGGEVFNPGQNVSISWTTCNIPSSTNAIIILNNPGNPANNQAVGHMLAVDTVNDGFQSVALPQLSDWVNGYNFYGNYYVVTVSFVGASDNSDNQFAIKDPKVVISTMDLTPRIAYWQGKVNQHWTYTTPVSNPRGDLYWATDPDGTSGAELDKNGYCAKWYPNTNTALPYKMESIEGWRNEGNTGGPFTNTVQTYKCVKAKGRPFVSEVVIDKTVDTSEWCSEFTDGKPRIKILSPNGREVYFRNGVNVSIPIRWSTCNVEQNSPIGFELKYPSISYGYGISLSNYITINGLSTNNYAYNSAGSTSIIETANTIPDGKNFKIGAWVGTQSIDISDSSDDLFTIIEKKKSSDIIKNTEKSIPEIAYTSAGEISIDLGADGVMKLGDRGEEVKKVQRLLTEGEFYKSKIDGVYGRKLRISVRKFEKEYDLKINGIIDVNDARILVDEFSPEEI